MSDRPCELIVAVLGDSCWDEATELTSMIADEHLPSILRDEVARGIAASIVVDLVQDPDFRRCIECLLRTKREDAQ